MSNQISLTIPNDDPIALRAFGNALEEMAVAHGAEVRKPVIISQKHAVGDVSVETVMQGITEPLRPYQQAALDTGAEGEFVPFTDDNVDIPYDPKFEAKIPVSQGGTMSDLDADGLPWDARIHSGNQERNADNTWRIRRRPKDLTPEQWSEQVAQVRDELFALMAIPVADPVEQPEPTTDTESPAAVFGAPEPVEVPTVAVDVPPAPPISDSVPLAPPVVAADPVPPAPAPLPPVTVGVPATLAELMTWLTSKAPSDDAGRAARLEQINGIVARHGLVTLGQLQKRLDLIPQVYADLVKELGV